MSGVSAATLDAYARIAARADDVSHAFTAGSIPTRNDAGTRAQAPLPSQDPLSVVAPPDAWFVARRSDGAQILTRDGGFHLEEGTLRTAGGAEVLGFPGGSADRAVPVPLRINATDAALGRGADASISADGIVAYTRATIDPRTRERTTERVVVGRIALAKLPAGTQAQRLDATTATAPAGVNPHLGTPSTMPFGGLVTFSRDRGGIDLDASLLRWSESYQHFDALRAATKARGGTDKTAMELVK